MSANGPNSRDGFERWVAALQRDHVPVTPEVKTLKPDVTAPLADESATHVHQIPKELIHRLRERETQGLLGVEVERTAVFKPPPELLARAKRMLPTKPTEPSELPPKKRSEAPTAPPPPEAAVPTVKPPPPAMPALSLDDDWSSLVEPALAALKPLAARSAPAARPSNPGRPPSVNAIVSRAPAAKPVPSAQPPGVVVARTVEVGKSVDVGTASAPPPASSPIAAPPASSRVAPPPASSRDRAAASPASSPRASSPVAAASSSPVAAAPPSSAPAASPSPVASSPLPAAPLWRPDVPSDSEDLTMVRVQRSFVSSVAGDASEDEALRGVEATEARLSGLKSQSKTFLPEQSDSFGLDRSYDSASGRRWVVIAAVFFALIIGALAFVAR